MDSALPEAPPNRASRQVRPVPSVRGKEQVAIKMDGIAMKKESGQAAIGFVVDIEAGAVETAKRFPKRGGGQSGDGGQKTGTAGVYKK